MRTGLTPGPWRISGFEVANNGQSRMVMGADDYSVAWVSERTTEENHANARLIAAAPDMLEACKAFVTAWDRCSQLEKTDVALQLARAAIRKAEGE